MLSSLTCGMAPVTSITEGLQQVSCADLSVGRTLCLSLSPEEKRLQEDSGLYPRVGKIFHRGISRLPPHSRDTKLGRKLKIPPEGLGRGEAFRVLGAVDAERGGRLCCWGENH